MKPDRTTFDTHMMAIALMMARRGLGRTAPNPSVGAVIADEMTGEVIARAVTAPGGRPHAETIAIAAAGARARGKTIYVTLEPCSHQGQTGPCAEAIVKAGLKRVVVGIEDPDPRVAGRGLDLLRKSGLEVQRGVLAPDARWVTRGHIVRVTERRPFVTLKMALDAEGRVPRGTGQAPVFVTSPEARACGHMLRAKADAILVGSGTVHADDPDLTCRLPGLEDRSPIRVVLSRDLDIPLASRLVHSACKVPLWCVCGAAADPKRRADLEAAGANIITVTLVGGKLWLPAIMEELVARGMTRVLVEGGPTVWRAFADASLIDEVVLFQAGKLPARVEQPVLPTLTGYLGAMDLTLKAHSMVGPDTMWRFARRTSTEGR